MKMIAQDVNFHKTKSLDSNCCYFQANRSILHKYESCSYSFNFTDIKSIKRLQATLQGNLQTIDYVDNCSFWYKDGIWLTPRHDCIGKEEEEEEEILVVFPHIQTLRKFPKEDLFARTVLVRFDSTFLLGDDLDPTSNSVVKALFTIKYVYEAGAKVVLASHWCRKHVRVEAVAGLLSSVLQLNVVPTRTISCYGLTNMYDFEEVDVLLLDNLSEFKEEIANNSKFAEGLASGVDIFINDSFSQSHKSLGSTVGISRFCYASLAGFQFEERLSRLKKAAKTTIRPYVAIIGGGNLYNKASALQVLATRCDGLVFVGMMAFQVMHALGLAVPASLVEYGAANEARDLIQFSQSRNIPILYPREYFCMNSSLPDKLQIFAAHGILDGWVPVDIAPNSYDEISYLMARCKKVTWIGPLKFKMPDYNVTGSCKLVGTLDLLREGGCDITVVGTAACKEITRSSCCPSAYNMIENASIFWEFLKGRKLPGVLALDRAYPHDIDWHAAYSYPSHPLVVDIGSGNGLFLLEMAKRGKDLNFLGLEINQKLVRRCMDSVRQSGIKNGYFIATNATSTFRSIVSTYAGELILVSVLCPNPDFDKPDYRWRMLQRSLIEAVADLLKFDGKAYYKVTPKLHGSFKIVFEYISTLLFWKWVFLQSDVEGVAARMKEEFLKYGKGKLSVLNQQDNETNTKGWLKENPFGVRSDWEQHAIDRGRPMYRLLLSKSSHCGHLD